MTPDKTAIRFVLVVDDEHTIADMGSGGRWMEGDQRCLPSLVAECMASRSDVHNHRSNKSHGDLPYVDCGWSAVFFGDDLRRHKCGYEDNLGFQFQLDNNSSGAAVYEWIDQVTFTVW